MTSAVQIFKQGGVLAYPTEAVFGLGCDPDNQTAVEKILTIKKRPVEKGLILLAGEYSQLQPYINESVLTAEQIDAMLLRWPNGVTQVVPASEKAQSFLTGQFDTIAIRVTDQPDVVELCHQTQKPIVSTSANFTGEEPGKTWQEVEQALGAAVDYIVKGETLGFNKPSTIIDAITGETFRS